jgi:hypothetical protein
MRTSIERVGIWGLGFTALLICGATVMQVYSGSLAEGPRDGWVQLIPWVITLVALALALFSGSRLRFALTAGAVVILLRLALPMLVEYLPGTERKHVVWLGGGPVDPKFLDSVASGSGLTAASDGLLWVASILVVVFVAVYVWGARALLFRRAATASFSIDLTVLLVVFYAVVVLSLSERFTGSFAPQSVPELVSESGLWLRLQLMCWLIPLVLWLAFTLRQGGAIALGSAVGLVLALLVIPNVMSSLESWLDGPSAQLIDSGGTRTDVSGGAYGVLDIWGPMPWAGLVAAVMLVIVVWWAVGTHAGGNPTRALAKTQSPVNSLSVVAFVLAWIPLTAIPGVVLGHMAYDQIVDGDTDQRGLGLSRWAIVLGYLSLVGALLLGYNVWAK